MNSGRSDYGHQSLRVDPERTCVGCLSGPYDDQLKFGALSRMWSRAPALITARAIPYLSELYFPFIPDDVRPISSAQSTGMIGTFRRLEGVRGLLRDGLRVVGAFMRAVHGALQVVRI